MMYVDNGSTALCIHERGKASYFPTSSFIKVLVPSDFVSHVLIMHARFLEPLTPAKLTACAARISPSSHLKPNLPILETNHMAFRAQIPNCRNPPSRSLRKPSHPIGSRQTQRHKRLASLPLSVSDYSQYQAPSISHSLDLAYLQRDCATRGEAVRDDGQVTTRFSLLRCCLAFVA